MGAACVLAALRLRDDNDGSAVVVDGRGGGVEESWPASFDCCLFFLVKVLGLASL
jgi:hypothetical protein